MALPSTGVWEVRPTNGANTNGGGFVAGGSGTDYSQQNAKNTVGNNISATDIVANGTTTLTSATINGNANIVDNIIYLQGGSGTLTAGWYRVATFVSNTGGVTTITVDRNVSSGTGITCNIGGAIQTLGQIGTILSTSNQNATGQVVWMKAEATVTVSAVTTCSPNGGTNAFSTQINGYTTTRGDNGQVTFQATAGTSYNIFTFNVGAPVIYRNFVADGNSRTGITGFGVLGAYVQLENCLAKNCLTAGFNFNNSDHSAWQCFATACGIGFITEGGNGPNRFRRCGAYANTGDGFKGDVGSFYECFASNNTGGTTDGWGSINNIGHNTHYLEIERCVSYGNGRYGWNFAAQMECNVVFENNIGWGNATDDIFFNAAYTAGGITANHNAYATQSGYNGGSGDVTLGGDPFTAGASNNFALNNTAGAGAACRAAGFPGVLPVGGTGNLDIGALQSPGAGSTTINYVIAPNIVRHIIEER